MGVRVVLVWTNAGLASQLLTPAPVSSPVVPLDSLCPGDLCPAGPLEEPSCNGAKGAPLRSYQRLLLGPGEDSTYPLGYWVFRNTFLV